MAIHPLPPPKKKQNKKNINNSFSDAFLLYNIQNMYIVYIPLLRNVVLMKNGKTVDTLHGTSVAYYYIYYCMFGCSLSLSIDTVSVFTVKTSTVISCGLDLDLLSTRLPYGKLIIMCNYENRWTHLNRLFYLNVTVSQRFVTRLFNWCSIW